MVQRHILDCFEQQNLCADHPPIVAVNQNSADAHYQPTPDRHSPVKAGDFLLIDLWARPETADGVYADITWTAFLGDSLPSKISRIFGVVRAGSGPGGRLLE